MGKHSSPSRQRMHGLMHGRIVMPSRPMTDEEYLAMLARKLGYATPYAGLGKWWADGRKRKNGSRDLIRWGCAQ